MTIINMTTISKLETIQTNVYHVYSNPLNSNDNLRFINFSARKSSQ